MPMTEHALEGFDGADQPSASIYDTCIRCGLCLPSCPTYLETMTETSGPRGRISLIKAVGESRLDLQSAGFVEQMWQCLDCRACEAACPSGVRYGQLVETARTQIRRAQAPDDSATARVLRRFFVRTLFARLDLMCIAALLLRIAQTTRLTSLAGLFGLARLAGLAPQIRSSFFVPNDRRFEAAEPLGIAFLHTGCIMAVAFGDVHRATVRMLRRARLSVLVPSAQGCCGAIAVHAGDMDFARELAKRNIAAFERSGADVYAVNAAGCGSALKEYPRALRRRRNVGASSRAILQPRARRHRSARRHGVGAGAPVDRCDRDVSRTLSPRSRSTRRGSASPAHRPHPRRTLRRDGRERRLLRQRRDLQSHAARDGVAPAAAEG